MVNKTYLEEISVDIMRMKFCCACFSDKNLHHHHLIPRIKGGSDDQTNLITLCGSCHAKIHNLKDVWSAEHKELQRIGIKKALENGVVFGAKAKVSSEQIDLMRSKRASGVLIKDLMSEFSLSKASVYRLLTDDDGKPVVEKWLIKHTWKRT